MVIEKADTRLAAWATLRTDHGGIAIEPLTADVLRERMAAVSLCPAVPEFLHTRLTRCRSLYARGAIDYEFFTVAFEQAALLLESALGAAFLAHYPGGVPLTHPRTGQTAMLSAEWFDAVGQILAGREAHRQLKGWRLLGHPAFDGGLRSLLDWARREGLLKGSRNRAREEALYRLRNTIAHTHGPLTVSPADAHRAITDAAELTNHLFGVDRPDGRWYGDPPPRYLFAVREEPGGGRMACRAEQLPTLPEDERSGRWRLLEATDWNTALPWLPDWDPIAFDMTPHPVSVVWVGGDYEGTIAALAAYHAAGRSPQPAPFRDRPFLIRYAVAPGAPNSIVDAEPCRAPWQFRALLMPDRDHPGWGWALVQADHPSDASGAISQLVRTGVGTRGADVRRLAATLLGNFPTWVAADAALSTL